MGAQCSLNSCNIMEVTNHDFGEDSEASHQTRETSSDSNGETDAENGETDSESQTDNSSTSYSITESQSDRDNNNNKNTQKYKRPKRKRRKKSMSISNTNPHEGGGTNNNDDPSITDVSDLSNNDEEDEDNDNYIDYATDAAIHGSMSDGTPSTAMSLSDNSSSSGLSTPIPSPSPLEIIRAVQLKQEQIREQIEKRRHSLPSTHGSYWINRKRSSFRPQTPQITGKTEYNYSNVNQEVQAPIPRPINITHRSRSAMDPNQNAIDIDVSKSILKQEINIEDMYNNNDYHEPQPLYNQFTANVPNTAPSFDSPNSIEEDLAKIPTISVLDKPMDIGFASSDEIPSDDNYASTSEVSSSEEYAGDDDDEQEDGFNYKRKKRHKSTRIAPWRSSHHRKNSSHSNSQRITVLNDDDEEKADIDELTGVVGIIHDINEIHVPIMSPTQSKSGGHSNSASLDGTNKHLHIRIQSLEDDMKGGLLNDEFDDVLPLASITPTNSFDADTLRKERAEFAQTQFSKSLTNKLMILAADERDQFLSIQQQPLTPPSPNTNNTMTEINVKVTTSEDVIIQDNDTKYMQLTLSPVSYSHTNSQSSSSAHSTTLSLSDNVSIKEPNDEPGKVY